MQNRDSATLIGAGLTLLIVFGLILMIIKVFPVFLVFGVGGWYGARALRRAYLRRQHRFDPYVAEMLKVE